jgi:serine/threonine-protein kinase
MELAVGQVLSGTLRLIRKVAQGGMGSVWIAEHLVLGKDVAVKFMARPWASVPSARTRFLREARMTAMVDSPHVVRVLDCRFTEGDEPYLVLELLRGEDLEQRVRRRGALPVPEVVEIVAQACEALHACHEAGIIHRDLKPENVFLVEGPRPLVKILDFGIAKPARADELHESDKLAAGTPQYMSPEQMFEPEKTDARSDLFALGAVAYFALTRRRAFDADTIEGLYLAIDGGSFTRASELRPELPPSLDAWFDKALANDPRDRFASAREMASALYDALREASAERTTLVDAAPLARDAREGDGDGERAARMAPEAATPSEPPELPIRRFGRSRRSLVFAAACALGAGLFVWQGDRLTFASADASQEADEIPDAIVEPEVAPPPPSPAPAEPARAAAATDEREGDPGGAAEPVSAGAGAGAPDACRASDAIASSRDVDRAP